MKKRTGAKLDKFSEALAKITPQELDKALREAMRLIQVEKDWREAGCPEVPPYSFDEDGG